MEEAKLIEFTWLAPARADGFRWVERPLPPETKKRGVGLVLEPIEAAPLRSYEPLTEELGLFRTFAETPQTPEGVLDFANRYGCLGVGQPMPGRPLIDPATEPGSQVLLAVPPLEPLAMWLEFIRWVQEMVGIWDATQGKDPKALAGVVEEDADCFRVVVRRDLPTVGVAPSPWDIKRLWETTSDWEERSTFEKDDPVLGEPPTATGAARFLLSIVLGYELKVAAVPCLVWDAKKQQPSLRVRPSSLWGAIMVQFAQAVAGDKKHRRCPVCGRWFELGQPDESGRQSRADKLTCSPSCRTRGYRVRQDRARALHAEGWSPKRIAKELGSDVTTVRAWLKKREG
jgi:hypothetical protein